MQSLLVGILTGLIRVALGGVIAWLLDHGIIQADDVEKLIAGIATAVITVAWVVWSHVKNRKEKLAALALSAGATLEEAKAVVKEGRAPSVMTPADTPPRLKS